MVLFLILSLKESGSPTAWGFFLFYFVLLWFVLLLMIFSSENKPKDRPFIFLPISYLVSFQHSMFILSDAELLCHVSFIQYWK